MGYSAYHHALNNFYIPKNVLPAFEKHFLLIWENQYIQANLRDGFLYRRENGKDFPYIPRFAFAVDSYVEEAKDYTIKDWLEAHVNTQPFVLSFRQLHEDPYGYVLIKRGRK
jgi:hypothetical protein